MYQSSESAFLLRGNRVDESAFGAPITLQGASWVAGADPFGGDALDASSGVATLPGNVRSVLRDADWTLEVWCKPATTPATNGFIVDIGVSPTPGYSNVALSVSSTGALNALVSLDGVSWVNMASFTGGSVPNGAWSYVEVTRRGSTLLAAVNGSDVISYALGGSLAPVSPGYIRIGGNPLTGYGNRNFPGLLGPMRLTQGVALRGAGGPLPVPTAPFAPLPPLVSRGAMRTGVAASAPLPEGSAVVALKAQTAFDAEDGGNGSIYGTVELYNQAGNIPLPRRVRLHRSRDGLLVRETWSDAQGNYRFDGITDRYKYDVIAWDHEGLQQSVVANDLTPEVMP